MTKLQTELTNEELLKLLETETTNKLTFKNPYLNFISKYNIKTGTFEVPTQVLLELFNVDNPRIGRNSFTKNMKKYIDWKLNRNNLVFLIDKDLLEISKTVENLILKKPKAAKIVRNRKRHIEAFLQAYNLKPGDNSVPISILIDLYDRWCYKYKRKKISIGEFQNLIPIYLPLINGKYYKVHDDLFKIISLETIKSIIRRRANAKKEN